MSEKKGRGALLSAVEKDISKSTVVILDFLNTIKGYRYELYCRAKTASTQHCVVFCDVTPETAKCNNEKLAENVRYEEKMCVAWLLFDLFFVTSDSSIARVPLELMIC
jgi:protein KTI12